MQRRNVIVSSIALSAIALGLVAACSGGASKIDAASSSGSTSTVIADNQTTSSTAIQTGSGSSTKQPTATSSTIAYFTVPPSTTAPAPDGGKYEPASSAGRKFVDAVLDGKKASAAPYATSKVMGQFEPWKPYSRTNDQGVAVPNYHFSGSTKQGNFSATLAPTVTIYCGVDTGKVVTCGFGE